MRFATHAFFSFADLLWVVLSLRVCAAANAGAAVDTGRRGQQLHDLQERLWPAHSQTVITSFVRFAIGIDPPSTHCLCSFCVCASLTHSHCRSCGRVLCDACSSKRWVRPRAPGAPASAAQEKVRVCSECYDHLMTHQNELLLNAPETPSASASVTHTSAKPAPSASAASTAVSASAATSSGAVVPASGGGDRLIYNTQTLCARCSFIERKGFALHPAQLWERPAPSGGGGDAHVVLVGQCATHGVWQTLVCSSAAFYQRMISFTTGNDYDRFLRRKRDPALNPRASHKPKAIAAPASASGPASASEAEAAAPKPQIADIEDLDATLKLNPQSKHLPLVGTPILLLLMSRALTQWLHVCRWWK